MALQLYNTLTGRKEAFAPLEEGKVRMYNCGPTVYGYTHIGNFASFLLADLLRRYLEYSGLEVVQVMNITDVGHLTEDDEVDSRGEDKLEVQARKERKDPWEIARFYEDVFHEDRQTLNLLDAHYYPRATEHVPEMVELIEELMEKGLAYRVEDQIYFEISKFPSYGRLSGNTVENLISGKRVEEDPNKRNPLDFCLWKIDPKHIMQWDSPWGRGFPGWHIECSAMSRKYLGEVFDIHTGGEDNIFPHHECEIAQSSGGENRVCSRFWVHRRHLLVDNKKMSKSLGNFYTIRDLLGQGHSGAEIRLALIGTHYRQQYNFSTSDLEAKKEFLRRLREFLINMEELPAGSGDDVAAVRDRAELADRKFRAAMDDDLNVSAALAEVSTFVRDSYKVATTREAGDVAREQLLGWDRVLGVLEASLQPHPRGMGPLRPSGGGGEADPEAAEIEALLQNREEARKNRDFAEADRVRDLLVERGIVIKDTPQGPRWYRGDPR